MKEHKKPIHKGQVNTCADVNGIEAFIYSVGVKLQKDFTVFIQPVIYGLSVVLSYRGQSDLKVLESVVSLGDGRLGEVLENVFKDPQRLSESYPSDIFFDYDFDVIGELVIVTPDFIKLNEERKLKDLPEYESRFKAASSICRSAADEAKYLTFIASDVIVHDTKDLTDDQNKILNSKWSRLQKIKENTLVPGLHQEKLDTEVTKVIISTYPTEGYDNSQDIALKVYPLFKSLMRNKDKLSFECMGFSISLEDLHDTDNLEPNMASYCQLFPD